MFLLKPLLTLLAAVACSMILAGQEAGVRLAGADSSTWVLTGIICDEMYRPVSATHVINLSNHAGDVTDSLGIFSIPVQSGDTLLVMNIAYMDTLVPLAIIGPDRHIMIRSAVYLLKGAKVFEWGSSYNDFSRAVLNMPTPQTLGETLGLPTQDPEYIPFDMDEENLKSVGFLISSPISYFYENFSKHAKSRRRVYWLNRNQEKIEAFEAIISPENISRITGLTGEELLEFLTFLYQELDCDYKCDEIRVYSDIHALWDVYQVLEEH